MARRIDWYNHPYLIRRYYDIERKEWENSADGTDRTGRKHQYFGCMFDWMDRKRDEWRKNPQAALKDAQTYAKDHGEDVWNEDLLEELVSDHNQYQAA